MIHRAESSTSITKMWSELMRHKIPPGFASQVICSCVAGVWYTLIHCDLAPCFVAARFPNQFVDCEWIYSEIELRKR